MKRFVAILLAVMLMIAVMPTAAFAASTKTVYVSRGDTNSRIYFRSGPGYDYPEKGTVYHKDKVSVIESGDDWSKVKITSTKGSYLGATGYIRTYYIDGTTEALCTGAKAIKIATKVYASADTSILISSPKVVDRLYWHSMDTTGETTPSASSFPSPNPA